MDKEARVIVASRLVAVACVVIAAWNLWGAWAALLALGAAEILAVKKR